MRDARERRAVDVTVTGRVQGVSFRMYAEREARRLGVAGWVRNEPDGTVAGHLEGEAEQVDALIAWCRQGPPAAGVDQVSVQDAADEQLTSFEVRF